MRPFPSKPGLVGRGFIGNPQSGLTTSHLDRSLQTRVVTELTKKGLTTQHLTTALSGSKPKGDAGGSASSPTPSGSEATKKA